jgi:hypothetical protein
VQVHVASNDGVRTFKPDLRALSDFVWPSRAEPPLALKQARQKRGEPR